MGEPWSGWIPGVLSQEQMVALAKQGHLQETRFDEEPPDASSFDLHISNEAWILRDGSVKPVHTEVYSGFLDDLGRRITPNAEGVFSLEPKTTYVFKIREQLNRIRPDSGIYGQATAKSSVGRMDVLARLIVDGMDGYEGFQPTERLGSTMYLEVTSMTFPVRIKAGTSLSQLRLFYGSPIQSTIHGKELARTIGAMDDRYQLHVDLEPVVIGGSRVVAFRANRAVNAPINLWKDKNASPADPCDYWTFCLPTTKQRLRLEEDAFYILRSKEKLALPGGVAAYCQAIDETIGEMRIHYAGFVHPWFGNNRDDGRTGTPLIFEVRGHDLSVHLLDNEVMARMTIYRMSMDQRRPAASPYDSQQLKLSGFFRDWPNSLRVDEQGKVSPL